MLIRFIATASVTAAVASLVLSGIILAAGDSSRMGSPKAVLLDRQGQPFVVRIVESMHAAGIDDIVVVTGRHHDQIVHALAQSSVNPPPRIVRNRDPSRGQLSSLWLGIEHRASQADAVVVTLVDVPMLSPTTITAVLDAWQRTRAPIVRPEVGGRRGHPVVFDRAVFDELLSAPLERGARVVLSAHYPEIVNVPVDDPGCLVDVDTPGDYRELQKDES